MTTSLSPNSTRISDENFKILKSNEYDKLLTRNYKISQLKTMAKFYKEKVSGNKKTLTERLYGCLKRKSSSIKLQRHWRGYIRRVLMKLRGTNKGTGYVNDTDFLSLDSIADIPYEQLFSFEENGRTFAFSAKSFYNLITDKDSPKNPYTRSTITIDIISTFYKFVKYSIMLNEPLEIAIDNDTGIMSQQHIINMKVQNTFNKIDTFGHITDTAWFNDLNRPMLIKFIMELVDIWEYRADIHIDVKRAIYPPNGKPFDDMNIVHQLEHDTNSLKTTILGILDRLIFGEQGIANQSLGAYYILCALTLVSHSAANALPWLYQSVAHT